MTRRLAITILLTVWAVLVAGGVVAYAVTRSVLLEAFDESLFSYAASVPGLVHAEGESPSLTSLGGDRFLVVDELRRTVARPARVAAGTEPKLVSAMFSTAQGHRVRTVEVRAFATGSKAGDAPRAVKVIYTRSAAPFDARMNRLGIWFIAFGAVGGLLTAGVAWAVSQSALRPLSRTAAEIGSIDERHLDRRIDATALPPELTPMADRLNELLARLEVAFAARQRFLADASHELRTPVAALVMTLEVSLRHPRDATAYRRTLESCLGDANALRQLVERLMEQVRSQNLSHDEPVTEIDLTSFLEQCTDNVAPLADVKGVKLARSITPGLRFVTAPGRLRSALTNLLSNAIEYNRPGGDVEVRCSPTSDAGLQIEVRDTGIGIADEQVGNVFDPFFRADASRRYESGHLGLGLSLVKAHVEALGGICTVTSQQGKGTTFQITLPARPAKRTQPPPVEAVRINADSHGRLIKAT